MDTRRGLLCRVVGTLGVVVVLLGGMISAGGSRVARAGAASAVAVRPGVITPRLTCDALTPLPLGGTVPVGPGTRPRPGVPDFTTTPGAPTRITSATLVAASGSMPEHCDVQGYVTPQVHFDLKLPTRNWEGRYLQHGCFGFCGVVVHYPTAFEQCDLQPGGDFAVAAGDLGHSGTDGLWAAVDPQLREDHGSRANHVLSLAAKAIITAFYGGAPRSSYFDGCSDGGREALMEAQRYPDDFDGIVAGAPANLLAPLFGEVQPWYARVNTDARGAQILTPAKLPLLHDRVMAACDGEDGLKDGQIDDPRRCGFDPGTLRCPAGQDRTDCLTAAQVETARKLYSGPVDARGQRLYPGGEPLGSELQWDGWMVSPPGVQAFAEYYGDEYLRHMAFPVGRPSSSLNEWRFTTPDFDRLRAMAAVYDATNADLSAFRKSGGKLIIWQGWADQGLPPAGILAYYQAVRDRMGGLIETQKFARLFMVPSMYHCQGAFGPDQFDMIDAITHWVERGETPDRIVATQTDAGGAAVRTRPLFPYPTRAVYTGSGSIDDAAAFKPVVPDPVPNDHVEWAGNDLFNA